MAQRDVVAHGDVVALREGQSHRYSKTGGKRERRKKVKNHEDREKERIIREILRKEINGEN